MRVVLGKPQHRGGDAYLPAFAVLVAELGEGLPGALGLAEAHEGVQQQSPRRHDEVVRRGEAPGQRPGGPQGG